MGDLARDWLNQATRDLAQADDSREVERHEWAYLACHQAAETAIKALHLHHGQEAWGHVIARLVEQLPEGIAVPDDFVEKGPVLDNFYIPSRSPNAHPGGAPFGPGAGYSSGLCVQDGTNLSIVAMFIPDPHGCKACDEPTWPGVGVHCSRRRSLRELRYGQIVPHPTVEDLGMGYRRNDWESKAA